MTLTVEDLRQERRSRYYEIMKAKFDGELTPEALSAIWKTAVESADNMSDACAFSDRMRAEDWASGKKKVPPMTGGPIDRSAAFPKAGLYRTICMRGD